MSIDIVEAMADLIESNGYDFDAIACQGVSGLVMASMLSFMIKKPLIVVRKDVTHSHSDQMVEFGVIPVKNEMGKLSKVRYIIVDDLIESGKTVNDIDKKIKSYEESVFNCEFECVGLYLYHEPTVGDQMLINGKMVPTYSLKNDSDL